VFRKLEFVVGLPETMTVISSSRIARERDFEISFTCHVIRQWNLNDLTTAYLAFPRGFRVFRGSSERVNSNEALTEVKMMGVGGGFGRD
jgi:hypothetical protein